ncbi:hypothetical protein ONZ43_g647 [Nemania bipapillata]|uniref:Uncharacterized protein n=1 Tax=Nemania bipapillata TaxID=110536 RepID=A0ACC2J7A7_9PEZI|nr:hypothetical protein ONZ43_g647 [Nemania bipapillata]
MPTLHSRGNPKELEPIAIVGSACRFPGNANTPSRLWQLLCNPKDLCSPMAESRLNSLGFYHPDSYYHGHTNVKQLRSYFLSERDVERRFDARFFGIKPAEADVMDPQARLLLETTYEALEAGGHAMEDLQGSDTSCFVGLMLGDYEQMMLRDEESIGDYHVAGVARSLVSNRLSYFFDWRGQSMTIDTACSSSMVAVHQAVQVLRAGTSRVAVAAGANMLLDTAYYIAESKLQMLSPDGQSRMWDSSAAGYGRGEGIATLVLKRLSDALADGDHIECVIRETGLNQDGRTKGITIRAGLDLRVLEDRPQYFEAHGTGTPAGDPIEAEAISKSFFGGDIADGDADLPPLFVGSVKTVIGHSEGAAGIAAIMKASLALQNSVVPPNLHFNQLNPKIRQFYTNLVVPTSACEWKGVEGQPRRASVNSFGFGGANAHVILQSYNASPVPCQTAGSDTMPVCVPFIFSAASSQSLIAQLSQFSGWLGTNDESSHFSLRDLAYTLHSRRSCLPFSVSITAANRHMLCQRIHSVIQKANIDSLDSQIVRGSRNSTTQRPKILGIFTGQGAQWARMGAQLIENYDVARGILLMLDARLSQLPEQDRPSWSLVEELLKDSQSSHINEATYSHPLCAAVQILLVDFLHAAGIDFAAVVGHSSGEIGAAYASGRLSADDAICIAYYRGLHSKHTKTTQIQPGRMLAVEATYDDVLDLCSLPDFEGKVVVAAYNSASNFTLAGDQDAIEQIKVILDDEGKMARVLRVDKAYHSHHMSRPAEAYLESLEKLETEIKEAGRCKWFSSVFGDVMAVESRAELKSEYWAQNMVKPVLFMQAMQSAQKHMGPFDLVLEVGPHAALKNVILQNLKTSPDDNKNTPYTSLLRRTYNDVESVADGLGYIWVYLGKEAVNLQGYDQFLTNGAASRLVKGLPSYCWDHDKNYWHESRFSRAIRARGNRPHELLGHSTPDSTKQETRWRNNLRIKEIPWLSGHKLQDQVVFPAAGYAVMALEACMELFGNSKPTLIEILDLHIDQALSFDESSSTEALFSLSDIMEHGKETITAKFKYYVSQSARNDQQLQLMAHGHVVVWLQHYSRDDQTISRQSSKQANLLKLDSNQFYDSMRDMDYQYSGPFRALTCLERGPGICRGVIQNDPPSSLLVHPSLLDSAFQAVLLAYSAPYDGKLWTIHVPKTVRRIAFNPSLCSRALSSPQGVSFESVQPDKQSYALVGDVDIFDIESDQPLIQVEGLSCVPLSPATAENDKDIFSTIVWDGDRPDARTIPTPSALRFAVTNRDILVLLERVAFFWLRNLENEIPHAHPARNFKLLHGIGQSLPAIINGDVSAIEIGMKDNCLADFYANAIGMKGYTEIVAQIVKQIVHRYPLVDILEIGAGTGAATSAILDGIGDSFSTYTFTDISSGFFAQAQERFGARVPRMNYKILDASQDPGLQDFASSSYDLVIALLVLHATPCLEKTLNNVRQLLRPGGWLVVVELASNDIVRSGAIFGAFPDWWSGADDGRVLGPAVSVAVWDQLLQKTGFSGCEMRFPDTENCESNDMSVAWAAQALDARVEYLRDPVLHPLVMEALRISIDELIIAGGQTSSTRRISDELSQLLQPHCKSRIQLIDTITDLYQAKITQSTTIISLSDVDKPLFQELTPAKFDAMKTAILKSTCILWVTGGRRWKSPLSNMTAGFIRSVLEEAPLLTFQFLDFEDFDPNTKDILQTFMRLKAGYFTRSYALTIPRAEYIESRQAVFEHLVAIPEERKISSKSALLLFVFLKLAIISQRLGLYPETGLLVFDPEPYLATLLEIEAERRGFETFFIAEHPPRAQLSSRWIKFSRHAPGRIQKESIPKPVTVFLDCAASDEPNIAKARILSNLPANTKVIALNQLFDCQLSLINSEMRLDQISDNLKSTVSEAIEDLCRYDTRKLDIRTIQAADFHSGKVTAETIAIVEWKPDNIIPVLRQPIDSQRVFAQDKTYWLAGLSGALGLSLAEWMVSRGAIDLTNREQLATLFDGIRTSLPPLAGIAQGAMVLEDTPLENMTSESMLKVTRPKVEGSKNLDEIVGDTPLDFFIFFSSVGSVVGNPGQSNYSAANWFMAALAEQRRRRGLAASIIHIGPILGVGYLAEANVNARKRFTQSSNFTFLSDRDLHQQFAEAIVAGVPKSRRPIESVTGLTRIVPRRENPPLWLGNPFMGHFILPDIDTKPTNEAPEPKEPLKVRLQHAASRDEIRDLVKHAFLPKLCALFRLDLENVLNTDLDTLFMDEIGIDSLIAVEVRSWWMRTLNANVPVLKILSGISVGKLITFGIDALELPAVNHFSSQDVGSLSEELIPILTPEDDSPILEEQTPLIGLTELNTPVLTSETSTSSAHSINNDISGCSRAGESTPLSFSQSMFWTASAIQGDRACLNHTALFRISGILRVEDLRSAISTLGKRHESLRTCFVVKDGQARQYVVNDSRLSLEHRHIRDRYEANRLTEEMQEYSFDWARGETMRIILLSLSPAENLLLLATHSLVMDGFSGVHLIREMLQLYSSQILTDDVLQFTDYNEEQRAIYHSGGFLTELEFWKNIYQDFPSPLPILKVSRSITRPNVLNFENNRFDIRIDALTKGSVNAACRRYKVTPFHFYLATLRALLCRYTDEEDIAIGVGDANRVDVKSMGSLGPYMNLLPVRFRTATSHNFGEVLRNTREMTYASLANSRIPFQVLLDE